MAQFILPKEAVLTSLNFAFVGTGKTCTAAQVAYQLAALNRREGNGGQVLFCAPSNHAVDVAASKSFLSITCNNFWWGKNAFRLIVIILRPK